MQGLDALGPLLLEVHQNPLWVLIRPAPVVAEGEEDVLVEVDRSLGEECTEHGDGDPDNGDGLRRGVVHGLPADKVGTCAGLIVAVVLLWQGHGLVPILAGATLVRPRGPSGPHAEGHSQAHQRADRRRGQHVVLQAAAQPIGILRELLGATEVGELEVLTEECLHNPPRGWQTVEEAGQRRHEDGQGEGEAQEEEHRREEVHGQVPKVRARGAAELLVVDQVAARLVKVTQGLELQLGSRRQRDVKELQDEKLQDLHTGNGDDVFHEAPRRPGSRLGDLLAGFQDA
mmetsp:Transcript_97905/g.247024  ORF Transcript_97905/g.247024 Transcript_97905/m.247024 type:complete len:287 (+) Transcript_97905:654-1514(+)